MKVVKVVKRKKRGMSRAVPKPSPAGSSSPVPVPVHNRSGIPEGSEGFHHRPRSSPWTRGGRSTWLCIHSLTEPTTRSCCCLAEAEVEVVATAGIRRFGPPQRTWPAACLPRFGAWCAFAFLSWVQWSASIGRGTWTPLRCPPQGLPLASGVADGAVACLPGC